MNEASPVRFPCRKLPDDPSAARLIGLHPQRQQGLWMQRLKITGGRLTGDQWRALADVAARYTPGTPLHLTTRQDIQIHDLTAEKIPAVQQALAEAGMNCLGAGGDSLRNVTVCPCSGLLAGRVDLLPLALEMQRMLESLPHVWSLPRKFKIGLSCSRGCGRPWINDMAFIAEQRGGRWGFRVIAAGSLGARPATGIELLDRIEPGEALAMVAAGVEVFAARGDRSNRAKARLRHVRERLGDRRFRSLLLEAFERAKAESGRRQVDLPAATARLGETVVLRLANGDLQPDAARALGDVQPDDAFQVRIADHHAIVVFGHDTDSIRARLAGSETLRAAAERQVSVVACPGTRWCKRALVDTNGLADRIRSRLAGDLPADVEICISGCPNGCAHSAVAVIGLAGCLISDQGQKREAFRIFRCGGEGRDNRLARPAAAKVLSRDVVAEVARCLRARRTSSGRTQ